MTINQNNTELFDHIRKRFPPELKRLISSYIPISILKTVRKIKSHELPKNYKIMKGLNHHFYMIHTGYKLDVMGLTTRLHYFENQLVKVNQLFTDSFNINNCFNLANKKQYILKNIQECKELMLIPQLLYIEYTEPYEKSIDQLKSFNLIESDKEINYF
jgi:hypothetical protein